MSDSPLPGEGIDALPMDWVTKIFRRLAARYGTSFTRKWDGIKISDVHSDWAQVLAWYSRKPKAIAYALDNLPVDKPPTSTQFRDLCRSYPEPDATPALGFTPKPPSPEVARELARLAQPVDVPEDLPPEYRGPKAWAYRLRDREAAGDKLPPRMRAEWRIALRVRD